MRITVRLFAILKDQAGVSQIELELPPESTAAAAIHLLSARFPSIHEYLNRVAIAVNRSYVKDDALLHDGDELALIPPVSGG